MAEIKRINRGRRAAAGGFYPNYYPNGVTPLSLPSAASIVVVVGLVASIITIVVAVNQWIVLRPRLRGSPGNESIDRETVISVRVRNDQRFMGYWIVERRTAQITSTVLLDRNSGATVSSGLLAWRDGKGYRTDIDIPCGEEREVAVVKWRGHGGRAEIFTPAGDWPNHTQDRRDLSYGTHRFTLEVRYRLGNKTAIPLDISVDQTQVRLMVSRPLEIRLMFLMQAWIALRDAFTWRKI